MLSHQTEDPPSWSGWPRFWTKIMDVQKEWWPLSPGTHGCWRWHQSWSVVKWIREKWWSTTGDGAIDAVIFGRDNWGWGGRVKLNSACWTRCEYGGWWLRFVVYIAFWIQLHQLLPISCKVVSCVLLIIHWFCCKDEFNCQTLYNQVSNKESMYMPITKQVHNYH